MEPAQLNHIWASLAVEGQCEESLHLLEQSAAHPLVLLHFLWDCGTYAFWQLVVWAVYEDHYRERLLRIADRLAGSSEKTVMERFSRWLMSKAETVAGITGEFELIDFSEQFVARLIPPEKPSIN